MLATHLFTSTYNGGGGIGLPAQAPAHLSPTRICEAVNPAQLKAVIHRDLKPGNIGIDPDGEPHVLNFGLAKLAPGEL